jgi:hypothetical protein
MLCSVLIVDAACQAWLRVVRTKLRICVGGVGCGCLPQTSQGWNKWF